LAIEYGFDLNTRREFRKFHGLTWTFVYR
jgi:hypothetical protein